MEITYVRIRVAAETKNNLCAFADVTFDDCFVVHGMKLFTGSNGIFVAMPSRQNTNHNSTQRFLDICHPVTDEFRRYIEDKVVMAYEDELNNNIQKGG